MIGWAKTIAHELGPDGITVNTVAPGMIDTPRTQRAWLTATTTSASIPARRAGTADEVAAAVVFLCSVPAAYISGVVLPVDGGALRGVW